MYIKSPINYTGNKYRILPQLQKYFPKHTKVFVDLFCGGATVGFNVKADKVILIDNNPQIINLLKFLAKNNIEDTIIRIEKTIKKYNLSYSYKYTYKKYREEGYVVGNNGLKKYNEVGFYKLRDDYNNLKNKNTIKANIFLYTLMVYGFNNDIRFNSAGDFNLPVGKTDFNKNNYEKLVAYNNRAKETDYEYICADFRTKEVKKILESATFVYCDPPYLITTAVYNENNGWNYKDEEDLLKTLSFLNEEKIPFALSNVLKTNLKTNEQLENWIKNNNLIFHNINYHYKSSSYNKKNRDRNEQEIVVTGGENNEVAN